MPIFRGALLISVVLIGLPFLLGDGFWSGFASNHPLLVLAVVVGFFGSWIVLLLILAFKDTIEPNEPY